MGVTLVRQISISHWLILAGVHFAVLLLYRYRYWPALVLGEAVSLIPLALTFEHQFGSLWAIQVLVPSIVFMMPIVYLFRRFAPIEVKGGINVGRMLACSLILSGIMTVHNFGEVALMNLPSGYKVNVVPVAARWVLGNFLGILTVVPFVLAVSQSGRVGSLRILWNKLLASAVTRDAAFSLIPALLVLMWFGWMQPSVHSLVQAAMFLPVVWMALRHGWIGAAVGGMFASLAVMTLMPVRDDAGTMQAEIIIAFTVSTMLLIGEQVAALRGRVEQERTDLRLTLALAQRNIASGEARLKVAAQGLNYVQETVRSGYQVMMGRLRSVQPIPDERGYGRQALLAQDQLYRLADCLHPITWRDRGLVAALQEGPLARMLEECGVAYRCDVRGPVEQLSSTLHLAIYRIVGEAVAGWCEYKDLREIELRLRAGTSEGRRWVVLSLVGLNYSSSDNQVRWEELLPRVERISSGLGLSAVRDRAATYEGFCREKSSHGWRRLAVLMLDPMEPGEN
ncbi:MASE1 domain-containing protein [Dyella aluminiiresistens]|uniref:MASE1 domain-containing protein n=1 Tax=Dyella aluminiiresistens TaxID=3069105 RepID=UPI00399D1F67